MKTETSITEWTLRDCFAASALPKAQDMVAANDDAALSKLCREFGVTNREQIAAHIAYKCADAMLSARAAAMPNDES